MCEIQINSSRINGKRTDWALKTTLITLEKSLMAWLRLSASLIVFAFTVFKFFEAMRAKGTILMKPEAPRNLGVFLIFFGMLLLGIGIYEYKSAEKLLLGGLKKLFPVPLTLWAAYVVFLVGLFMLLNMFFGLGEF
jgi:uncharacterized membrane protein YidH (DUF202 family)